MCGYSVIGPKPTTCRVYINRAFLGSWVGWRRPTAPNHINYGPPILHHIRISCQYITRFKKNVSGMRGSYNISIIIDSRVITLLSMLSWLYICNADTPTQFPIPFIWAFIIKLFTCSIFSNMNVFISSTWPSFCTSLRMSKLFRGGSPGRKQQQSSSEEVSRHVFYDWYTWRAKKPLYVKNFSKVFMAKYETVLGSRYHMGVI